MSIVKEGWIEKCGPRLMPTWNKRWLVLYDSRVLEYFIDNSKKTLQGQIELTGNEDLNINGDPGKQFQFGFYLETDSRTYKFAVRNADQRAMWISALRDVISGNISKKIEARRKGGKDSPQTTSTTNTNGNTNDINQSLMTGNNNNNKNDANGHARQQSQGFEKFTQYVDNGSRTSLDKGNNNTNNNNNSNNNNNNNNNNIKSIGDVANSIVMSEDRKESNAMPPALLMENEEEEEDENINDSSNINRLIVNNPKVVETLVGFLIDAKKSEFKKLFQINKAFRNTLCQNSDFYNNYTVYIYPKHVLKKFSSKRSQTRPWIMAHDYKQVWVFGNVERMTYAHLNLSPFNLDGIKRIFIDDPKLWDVFVDEIEDILAYLKGFENKAEELTVRCWKSDPGWIQQLPRFSELYSLTMEFSFQRSLLSKKLNIINASNILYLSLRRVDLLTDERNNDIALRSAFHSLEQLLVCNLEESRWDNAIVLPPQLKVLRYIPSDKSDIDLQRLVNENDTDSEDDQGRKQTKFNYECELIIKQELWPNALNHNIISGHEAYQSRKLRVWVLKKSRRWDGKLLYVNYCNQPPPMKAFQRDSCYQQLLKLDNLQNMGQFWVSRKTKYLKKHGIMIH